MFIGSVIDGALALLGDSILIVRGKTPPAVLHPGIDSGLIVLEAERLENKWFGSIFLPVRVEPQPESHRIRVVHRNPETNCMVGLSANACGGVPGMRGNDPMR